MLPRLTSASAGERRRVNLTHVASIFLVSCLPHTGSAKLFQRFVETPKSVEVLEGADVALRCRIEHQQGQAQWTKDGFALGFEREIPGYPRYTYLGDPEVGEHHLLITSATLTDDGEYQCQVGPTLTSPPIWAAANLTVLLPPARISVEGESKGSVVQVVAGKSFTLQCLVADSRPPPTVRWYLGHHQVDPGQVESQVVPTSSPQRWSMRSQLALRARAEDDGKTVMCRGEHPALVPPAALTASRTLVVLHRPSTPIISGYLPGEALHVGELRTLTCHVSGGNPRPSLLWYRSGRLLDDTFSSDAVGTVNTHELLVTPLEDGSHYECQAQSILLEQPLVVNVTLTVHYPPSEVSVRGPSRAEVGTSVSLRCDTSKANPPASLSWLFQGKEVSSPSAVVSRVRSGGWVSRSRLLQRVDESQLQEGKHQLQVVCRAHHPALARPSHKALLITVITDQPVWREKPISWLDVREGADLVLMAHATANPGPVRYWWRRGEIQVGSGEVLHLGPLTRNMAANYTVSAYTQKGAINASFYINVQYEPESLRAPEHVTVSEGDSVNVQCSTTGNPTPHLTWTSKNLTVGFGKGVAPLVIKSVGRQDTGKYLCHATSPLASPQPITTKLIVTQPPSFTDDTATTHGSWVDLGKRGHLVCHVRAAPPPNFTWTTEDTRNIQTNEKFIIHKSELLDGLVLWASVLEVVNITHQDYGDYLCSATNDLGTDSTWLTLKPPTRPHPPTNLTQIVNVSDVSVVLGWTPNSDAGMPLGFTVKYRAHDTFDYQYEDIEGSSTGVRVTGLSPGRKYIFSVQARNDHGNSDYVSSPIPITTLGTAAKADRSGSQHLTSLLLLVIVVSATALLVLNVVLILCFLRQHKRRNTFKSASSAKITSLATQRNTPASNPEDQHHHILMSLITDSNKIPKGYQVGHHDTEALDQNINSVCSTSPTRQNHRTSQKGSTIKWNGTLKCNGKIPNNANIYTQNNHTKIDSAFLRNQLVGNGRMSSHKGKTNSNTIETSSLIPKCKVSGLPQMQQRNSGLDDDQVSESSHESTDTAIFCDTKASSPSVAGQQQIYSHITNEHDTLSYVQQIRNEFHQQAAAQQQLKHNKSVKLLPECTTETQLHNNKTEPHSLDYHQHPKYHLPYTSRGSDPASNPDRRNPTYKAELTTVQQQQQDKPSLSHTPTTTRTSNLQHQRPSSLTSAQLHHLTPEMPSKTQQHLLPPSPSRNKKCLQQPAAPTKTQHCRQQPDSPTRARKQKISHNSPTRVQQCHLPLSPTRSQHRNQPPNSSSRLQNRSLPPNSPTKSQDCHQPPYLPIRAKNPLPPAQRNQHYCLPPNSPNKIQKHNLSPDTPVRLQHHSPFKSPSKNKHSSPINTPTRIKHRPPPVPQSLNQHRTPPTPPKLHHRPPLPSPKLHHHHPPTIKSNLEHPSLISSSFGWPCPTPNSPFLEQQLPPTDQPYHTQCRLSPDIKSLVVPQCKSDYHINTVPTTSAADHHNYTVTSNLSHKIPQNKLSKNTNHGAVINDSSATINSSHHNDSNQKDDKLSKNDRNTYQGLLISQSQSHAIMDDQAPVATSSPITRARRSRFPDDFLRQKRSGKL